MNGMYIVNLNVLAKKIREEEAKLKEFDQDIRSLRMQLREAMPSTKEYEILEQQFQYKSEQRNESERVLEDLEQQKQSVEVCSPALPYVCMYVCMRALASNNFLFFKEKKKTLRDLVKQNYPMCRVRD
jgi:hypothetical protein